MSTKKYEIIDELKKKFSIKNWSYNVIFKI